MRRNTLDEVIRRLRSGNWVSGEAIARELNVSRSAIWKHVLNLKEAGFEIQSSSRGYKLSSIPDNFYPPTIKFFLETRFLGQRIDYHFRLPSSQDRAKILAEKGAKEGLLVICEEQSGGRGRRGRRWVSTSYKSLTFSLLFRPSLSPWQMMQFPLMASLALSDVLSSHYRLCAHLKWPNDVLIGRRKVAGILAEMSGDAESINYIVLGVGININMEEEDFPDELKTIATSLLMEIGKKINRVRFLGRFLKRLEDYYLLYVEEGFSPIREKILAISSTVGSEVVAYQGEGRLEGKAVDIDSQGNLVVIDSSGSKHVLCCGDVTIRDKGK